jgi:glycosyltransferase involved in cell wall biosynthesis
MTTQYPLVSLIVRTKDRPKFLQQALSSIAAQTYHNIEIILVNDGGCDLDIAAFEQLLSPVSLFYIKNEASQGRSVAANLALDNINGQYVGFLDDDDVLLTDHLTTLVTFLEQSDYLIAYTNVEEYNKHFDVKTYFYQSKLLNTYSKDFDATELLFYNYIPFNGLLFNAEIFKDKRLDTNLELYEDWDILIRLSLEHVFYHIDKVTAHYNKWSDDLQINNLSQVETMETNQALIIKRYMNHISPVFLRQLWSEHLSSLQSIQLLKQENQKLQGIIDDRQQLINDMEANVDKIIQEKDDYFRQHVDQLNQQYQAEFEKITQEKDDYFRQHVDQLNQQYQAEFEKYQAEIDKYQAEIKKIIQEKDEYFRQHVDHMNQHYHTDFNILNKQHKAEFEKLNKQYATTLDKDHALINEYLQINGECKRKIAQIQKEKQTLSVQYDDNIQVLSNEVTHLSEQLIEKSAEIEQTVENARKLQSHANHLETEIQQTQSRANHLETEIQQINISFAWRVVNRLRKVLIILFPSGSLRYKWYFSIRHAIGQLIRLAIKSK